MTTLTNPPCAFDLQICETCRKYPARGVKGEPVKQLIAAAKGWAQERGRQVAISEVSCLSGCAVGYTAMIETPDASVRLHSICGAAELVTVLNDADGLLAGKPKPEAKRHQLSRTDWSMWRD